MISQIFLIAWVLWTHSQGWTDPFEVIDHWGSAQSKELCVTPGDHIHQIWQKFEDSPRVGYNIVLPDGTKLVSDQMISNDVQAGYPEIALLGADSVVMVWQESSHFWFQVRGGDGDIVTPTTEFPIPPSSRVNYDMDCDSLKRIHMVCAQIESTNNEFVLYTVHEIDGTLLFADTLPDHSYYNPYIHIDGNRVHIKYRADNPWRTMYIQYDLDGNIIVGPVFLFDDDLSSGHCASIKTDNVGDPYILIRKNPDGEPSLFALYKLDKETGSILINGVTIGQGEYVCQVDNDIPVFQPMPGDTSFYASWLRGTLFVDFCIIDQNGDFIEEPYVAYDYSDEEIQQIQYLRGATNEEGDCFLTWSEGDTLVWGYYIVLGVLDFDWVGTAEENYSQIESGLLITPSINPFSTNVSFTVSGFSDETVEVFDLNGRLVRTLYSDSEHYFWDGCSSSGARVTSGTYFVVLNHGEERSILKVVKLE
ncbi:MAG: T9SS type A sorting domain-containing protein [Candidatus Fermentibacteria bacterium]|nr:T9SS type A sorting domain-containing protein [Candidatus Fermentibacteria bacterium]